MFDRGLHKGFHRHGRRKSGPLQAIGPSTRAKPIPAWRSIPQPTISFDPTANIVITDARRRYLATAGAAESAKTADSAKTAGSAVTATTAGNATTTDNALSLGGIPASGYTRSDCASVSGQIKGFAYINGPAVSTSGLSAAGVGLPYNCSGGVVLALSPGEFEVETYDAKANSYYTGSFAILTP